MASFIQAIEVILRHEGGYVDHPSDPGGATNFGISLRWLRAHGYQWTAEQVRKMSRGQAIGFYRAMWDGYKYGAIEANDVATKCFDLAVNMGWAQANKLIQRAANDCGAELDVDGVCGSQTLAAINAIEPTEMLSALIEHQSAFYKSLADARPEMKVFLKGWLQRAAWPRGGE